VTAPPSGSFGDRRGQGRAVPSGWRSFRGPGMEATVFPRWDMQSGGNVEMLFNGTDYGGGSEPQRARVRPPLPLEGT
jgi:hypothetical protein